MIAIVDYGMGNLLSVHNALSLLGADARICAAPGDLAGAERIVLPGVGAFGDCMRNLRERGFVDALNSARAAGTPVFGICLGMQAMARRSFEGGEHEGLGWFEADVVRLAPGDPALRVPQIGWNDVSFRDDSPLFRGLRLPTNFYFVHSYHMTCDDAQDVDGSCEYAGPVTAAVRKGNVFATQFHPEKSQDDGLRVLENFLRWNPAAR
jgi:imidazole glycerol-phosphate synthase subunit HisH